MKLKLMEQINIAKLNIKQKGKELGYSDSTVKSFCDQIHMKCLYNRN